MASRYSPAIRKALERRMHSISVFAPRPGAQQAGLKAAAGQSDSDTLLDVGFDSVWAAADAGNVREVKRLVAETGFDVRSHSRDGGSTLLHHACWLGDLGFAWYLIDLLGRAEGPQAVAHFVNAVDSAMSGTTPLILVCRTTQGALRDRVELLELLLSKGAAPLRQDKHGDNCLHWAARRRAAPLVRMLLRQEDSALFLATAKNLKGLTPVDAAASENDRAWRVTASCKRRSPASDRCVTCDAEHATPSAMADVLQQLQRVVRGGGLRLKLLRNAQMRAQAKERSATERAVAEAGLMRHAASLVERARALRMEHREGAEQVRRRQELAREDEAAAEAVAEAEVWLDTKEGAAWERKAVRRIVREQRLAGKKIGPKARRETAAKARKQYEQSQARQARAAARREFRADQPPNFECPVSGCETVFVEEAPFLEHQIECEGELDEAVLIQQQTAMQRYEALMETAWTHVKVETRDRKEKLAAIKEAAVKQQEALERAPPRSVAALRS